jgi:hypothetical protein
LALACGIRAEDNPNGEWTIEQGRHCWKPMARAVQHVGGTPKNVVEWKVPLAPGEQAELRLIISYGAVRQETAQKLAALDSTKQLIEVIDFWKKLQYGCGQIHTPDPFVNDYLVAVAGQMAQ